MTEKKITGELEKFSYSLGMSIAGNLIQSGVKTVNPELFLNGFKDVFKGAETLIHPEDANQNNQTSVEIGFFKDVYSCWNL